MHQGRHYHTIVLCPYQFSGDESEETPAHGSVDGLDHEGYGGERHGVQGALEHGALAQVQRHVDRAPKLVIQGVLTAVVQQGC